MIRIKKKENPNFPRLAWVCKARSDDPLRPVLALLNIAEPELAVATDGRRLHEAKLPVPMETGLYAVLKATASELWLEPYDGGLTYPLWRNVRADGQGGRTDRVYEVSYPKPRLAVRGFSTVFCRILADLPHSSGFDFALFRDACPPKGEQFHAGQPTEKSPLVLQTLNGSYRSVLMPIYL